MNRHFIKHPVLASTNIEISDDDKEMLRELRSMGVEAKVMFNRSSSRGTAVSYGEPNLLIYCPESLYSKEFKEELEDVIGNYGWFPHLERRGRDSKGNIKLRVF